MVRYLDKNRLSWINLARHDDKVGLGVSYKQTLTDTITQLELYVTLFTTEYVLRYSKFKGDPA